MTPPPNPHRGSDFNGFLIEQRLMTPTMQLTAQLREYNQWRRGVDAIAQPEPAAIGSTLDAAADRLEELERELAAERALADRLASVLTIYNYDLLAGEMIQFVPEHDASLAEWKQARES
jgi:hypothetical protein